MSLFMTYDYDWQIDKSIINNRNIATYYNLLHALQNIGTMYMHIPNDAQIKACNQGKLPRCTTTVIVHCAPTMRNLQNGTNAETAAFYLLHTKPL